MPMLILSLFTAITSGKKKTKWQKRFDWINHSDYQNNLHIREFPSMAW